MDGEGRAISKKLYYKIGEACKAVDIQPYVLRYWETEFAFLAPDKSSSGQRVYTERDLQQIRRIKELLYDEGYTIAGAKKRLELEEGGGDEATLVAVAEVDDEAPEAAEGEDLEVVESGLDDQVVIQVDTQLAERVESLEAGVRDALEEVRSLLGELDSVG